MAGRKYSDAQYELRIKEVIQMTCRGYAPFEIREQISKKWDLSEAQVGKDLQEAKKRIKEITEDDVAQEVADAVMRYKKLIQINFENGDLSEVRFCQTRLDKLFGLEEATKVDITTKGQALGMSDEEIAQRIEELKEFKNQTDK